MIVPPAGVRVLVAMKPVDFRAGMDRLAAIAKEVLAEDPFSGTVLVFRARRADRVKLLVWDGTGLVLVSKRLEQRAFKWPPITDGVMRLSPAQLAALVEGLDWSRVHVPEVTRPTAVQKAGPFEQLRRCGKLTRGSDPPRHSTAAMIRCPA